MKIKIHCNDNDSADSTDEATNTNDFNDEETLAPHLNSRVGTNKARNVTKIKLRITLMMLKITIFKLRIEITFDF